MATKGQLTRDMIVAAVTPLFNTRGFAGTSMSEVLDATGLQKGGIYRHFRSKDDLAIAAFDYAVSLLHERYDRTQAVAQSHVAKLLACVDAVASSIHAPPVLGGCPILNTAIESDDTHELLRERAAAAMMDWQERIRSIVRNGIGAAELREDIDPATVATVITSSLEGAIMVTSVLRDPGHMQKIAEHLRVWIESLRKTKKGRRS